MAPEHEGDTPGGYGASPHMKTVALSILIMGVSIAIVIVLWVSFGHVGPTFSSNRLVDQQAELRQSYNLPPQPPVSKKLLEIPPSLRNLTSTGRTTTNTTSTTSLSNRTNSVNQASVNATPANQTAGAKSTSTVNVSIVQGAVSKTIDAFDPNPAKVTAGNNATWTNNDSVPHTVTSGQGANPDGKFDSGILTTGQTFGFRFEKAGEYQYYCMLHPTMMGTISVS